MTENELRHHGILGQKWGVRRFQNADGSYTSAGKKRYGIDPETGKKSKEGRRLEKGDREVNYYATRSARRFRRSTDQALDKWHAPKYSKEYAKNELKYDVGARLALTGGVGIVKLGQTSGMQNYHKGSDFKKKAEKSMQKYGIKIKDVKSVDDMLKESGKAGRYYVERTAGEKVARIATDAAVSIGGRAAALALGVPIAPVKISSIGEVKYKMNQENIEADRKKK